LKSSAFYNFKTYISSFFENAYKKERNQYLAQNPEQRKVYAWNIQFEHSGCPGQAVFLPIVSEGP